MAYGKGGGKKAGGGGGGGRYINHKVVPPGSNPTVPTESIQGQIDDCITKDPKWASHKGKNK